MKNFIFLIFLFLSHATIYSENISITVDTEREYKLLDSFLRFGVEQEQYGYVLESEKPISICSFYPLDQFPLQKDFSNAEELFKQSVLIQEVIPIWNKNCASQKKFVLKAVPHNTNFLSAGLEVAFIHLPKLQQVIEENIHLFRYILSPTITSAELAEKIAYSNETLTDILQDNRVLEGIVLGFGTHNSVVGGRKENVQTLFISQDEVPFNSKGKVLNDNDMIYRTYYLDVLGGDKSILTPRNSRFSFTASQGFKNISDEFKAIDAITEPLPDSLYNQFPRFVFGAYKGGTLNQPFFEKLKQTQKKIQKLLKNPRFLEEVLTKISGKNPKILCKKISNEKSDLSFLLKSLNNDSWKSILQNVLNEFENDSQRISFMEVLSGNSIVKTPEWMGASTSIVKGMKNSQDQLSASKSHFEILSCDEHLQEIVPQYLYYKVINEGKGKEFKNSNYVRVEYSVTDPNGNILFAHFDNWIDLSQTIVGFAHGITGMKVGESREIFVHPCYAYGVMTSLPSLELVLKVKLLDFTENNANSDYLPPLEPIDVNWVYNSRVLSEIEQSVEQLPAFKGFFYRTMMKGMEEQNRKFVLDSLIVN